MAGPAATWRSFNQRVMIPLLRSPIGRLVHSPLVGYIAVLTTTGRRSGQPRSFPLCYAIRDGAIYFIAGYGRRSDWFRNLLADPSVTVELPGRTVHGIAEVLTESEENLLPATEVLRNAGVALLAQSMNPFTLTPQDVRAADTGEMPLVRVRSARPIEATAWDAGGRRWMLPHVVAPLLGLLALVAVRRKRR